MCTSEVILQRAPFNEEGALLRSVYLYEATLIPSASIRHSRVAQIIVQSPQ